MEKETEKETVLLFLYGTIYGMAWCGCFGGVSGMCVCIRLVPKKTHCCPYQLIVDINQSNYF